MAVVIYLMTAMFAVVAMVEWLEKQARRYHEKHPQLNYRKQWM